MSPLSQISQILGAKYVLAEPEAMQVHLIDQRKRFQGCALAIVFPGSTEEVAAIVKICNQFNIPIVTQGGNTGLVLGSVPDQDGRAIVLSTRRLRGLIKLDKFNHTITVAAGTTLAEVQQWAIENHCVFPLSLASEGSCTLGGNLASNAGGTAVLRYGNARDLCLGLEVVLASGEILHGLRGLRKDNTGYDLRDLFIGSEGTLGIITAAVMKLYPAIQSKHDVWLELDNLTDVLCVFDCARQQLGPWLTGFELMSQACIKLVETHFPHYPRMSAGAKGQSFAVLLEVSDTTTTPFSSQALMTLLENLATRFNAKNWKLAQNQAQSEQFWAIREAISEAQAKQGPNFKHDISLPISNIPQFHTETEQLLQKNYANSQVICFGHIGDGNLHYNISVPQNEEKSNFSSLQTGINRLVHDQVAKYEGSISAEHGIGMLKRDELLRYKTPVEIALMKEIKRAFDPKNILNPGKILHEATTLLC